MVISPFRVKGIQNNNEIAINLGWIPAEIA